MITEEKEIKLDLLNESNYTKFLENLTGEKKERTLINCFFDTENWALSNAGWALRIRKDKDITTITAKGLARGNIKRLTVRPEIEEEMPHEKAERLIKKGLSISDLPERMAAVFKQTLKGKRLTQKLSFVTDRTTVGWGHGDEALALEIDRTRYSDGSVDYELEIELDDKGVVDKAVEGTAKIFNRLNIPLFFQKDSKFARALQRLEHIESTI